MVRPEFKLPDFYTDRIRSLLSSYGADLANGREVAAAVQKMSDFYIANPTSVTPYEQDWAKIAYAAYYFPLNYVRARAVVHEAHVLGFFDGLSSVLDFGSGPGTLALALMDGVSTAKNSSQNEVENKNENSGREIPFWQHINAVERSPIAINMHKILLGQGSTLSTLATKHEWNSVPPKSMGKSATGKEFKSSTHLNAFSYSFTELDALPRWATESEALLIIEPATKVDGRRLMEQRQLIMDAGYRIWGPCTHEEACPLLAQSKRDWCHDRITWTMPPWFQEIENHLPIKNRTLTFSWLLARRAPPPVGLKKFARLTGDLQKEKGASKQLVCRGPAREFLAWQHKNGTPPEFPRGMLLELSEGIAHRSNELRPQPNDCLIANLENIRK